MNLYLRMFLTALALAIVLAGVVYSSKALLTIGFLSSFTLSLYAAYDLGRRTL